MLERIKHTLADIEAEFDVRILFACESGSRAWGFASPDSDFDVRFVYIHRSEWYLSIDVENARDVIEKPIIDDLDINGWDARKALRLLYKSNPPLLEWLGSPIQYQEYAGSLALLQEAAARCYSPVACAYHYRQMAKTNYVANLRGDEVKLKKYLYVLRPLLAVRWIEAGRGAVPTPFGELLAAEALPAPVQQDIDTLLIQKSSSGESARGPRLPSLHAWIEEELARVGEKQFDLPVGEKTDLDTTFRELLHRAWR
ncbi:MAG TPA: nucleotidyltransferase domain-containing protein [Abditibacteriaceae bacterium]|jgi:hypothetical protein